MSGVSIFIATLMLVSLLNVSTQNVFVGCSSSIENTISQSIDKIKDMLRDFHAAVNVSNFEDYVRSNPVELYVAASIMLILGVVSLLLGLRLYRAVVSALILLTVFGTSFYALYIYTDLELYAKALIALAITSVSAILCIRKIIIFCIGIIFGWLLVNSTSVIIRNHTDYSPVYYYVACVVIIIGCAILSVVLETVAVILATSFIGSLLIAMSLDYFVSVEKYFVLAVVNTVVQLYHQHKASLPQNIPYIDIVYPAILLGTSVGCVVQYAHHRRTKQ